MFVPPYDQQLDPNRQIGSTGELAAAPEGARADNLSGKWCKKQGMGLAQTLTDWYIVFLLYWDIVSDFDMVNVFQYCDSVPNTVDAHIPQLAMIEVY